MTDLSPLGEFIDASILDSPRLASALEDFIVEAVEEATDLLRFGDMTTRTQLIKTVLSMALKAKESSSAGEAEKVLAKAREQIAGILED